MQTRRWGAAVLALALTATACPDDDGEDAKAKGAEKAGTRSGFSSTADPTLSGIALSPDSREGITVAVRARTEVEADQVFLVLVPTPGELGSDESEGVRPRVLDDLLEALGDVGVKKDDLDVRPETPFVTGQIRVRLDRADLEGRAEDIVDAVEDEVGLDSEGLLFGVTDCDEALAGAQGEALERARGDAEALAEVVGVTLGAVSHVAEAPEGTEAFGSAPDPCDPGADFDPYAALAPLEAEPTVELDTRLIVTFAVEDAKPAARTLSAQGTGSATVPADEAYVFVLPDVFSEEPETIEPAGRDEILAALSAAGIGEDDIDIDDFQGATQVRVEIDASELPDLGDKIVDAVEEVLEGSTTAGVVFSSSTCEDVLARAHRAALQNAQARLERLADQAHTTLGRVVGAAATGRSNAAAPPAFPVDPCADDAPLSSEELYAGSPLRAFDAEPVFEARVSLLVTRAAAG